MNKTKIEWADTTWNPITGCGLVSKGCLNCYAMHAAHRMARHPNPKVADRYKGLTFTNSESNPIWNGNIKLHEDTLLRPLSWRKKRFVFVNSMSDLFHESVPLDFLARVWAVMQLASTHTFMILTKRTGRMYDFLHWEDRQEATLHHLCGLTTVPHLREHALTVLPNVWLGISAEDQASYDERARHLNACPATLRFLSLEPLLGPIYDIAYPTDWIIVGGESGKHARPMHPNWVRAIRRHCLKSQIPFFFKQWGEWAPASSQNSPIPDNRPCHEFGDGVSVYRLGKRQAGRIIDNFKEQARPKPR